MRERIRKLFCSDTLLSRCARGGTVLAAAALFERGVRFVRNIVLARLLAPDQFGLMAIVLATGQLFEAFTEVGVRQSVIQNKRGDSEPFLNVVWWFAAIRGCLLYVAGFAAAPWIAAFFREPALVSLLRTAFLTMVFIGFVSPRFYVLEKHLQFGRYVWIAQGSGLAGTAVSLVTVVFMPNVWALVAGFVAEAAVRSAASFLFCPLRPTLRFDRQCWSEFLSFARGMAGLPVLTFVVMQMDVFVMGRMCSRDALGMYALALALAQTPLMILTRIGGPLTLPVLSGFQDDASRLQEVYLRITRTVWFFGLPLFAVMASCGSTVLSLAYGRSYSAVAVAFVILCVYSQVHMTGTFIMSTYLALGRPALHRRFAVFRLLLVCSVMYPAVRWFGPAGAAGALLLSASLATVVQVGNLSRVLSMPIRRYLAAIARGIPGATTVIIPTVLFGMLWPTHAVAQLVLASALCVGTWVAGVAPMRNRARGVLASPPVGQPGGG